MKISEKRQADLYAAISSSFMDERVQVAKVERISSKEIDARLYNLERIIWRKVHRALNLDSTA